MSTVVLEPRVRTLENALRELADTVHPAPLVVARFPSQTRPNDPQLIEAIEKLL
jgi:hypothetical protein